MTACDFTPLNAVGLNLQAILAIDALPPELRAELRRNHDPAHHFRQLILIGHAGKTLWESIRTSGQASENPIDDFSTRTVEHWLAEQFPGARHTLIYPGNITTNLQTLGTLAGWHHPSPFMLGIQPEWGTWYAYRVVILTDTDLEPTTPLRSDSPCDRCQDKPCVSACPAEALSGNAFSLEECVSYRKLASSRCKTTCIARISCPVGAAHRYCDDQIRHTYAISMQAIERYC